MPITNKVLINAKEMESALTLQYTAPADGRTTIDKFTATNVSGSTAIISVYLAAAGDTIDDTKKIVDAQVLDVDETYVFPEITGHSLSPQGTIYTEGTASALTIRASGREIT